MLKALLNISELLIAWGLPTILNLISNIFIKKKIKRDGYKFTDGYKFITKDSLVVDIIFSLLPIFGWMMCITSLSIILDDKSYKRHLEDLLKDKSIVPIYYFSNAEIKKRNDKKIKKVTLELGAKGKPMEIEKKSSKTRVEENSKISKEKIQEQIDLPKKDKRINRNSRDTKVMIEIGYLLELIKQVDFNLYEKKYKEYQDMLLAGTNGLTLSRTSDYVFLEEFKLGLEEILEKDKDKITLGNFQKIKLEYERHFQEQNRKTKLTFNDIENMAKKYLQERTNYSPSVYNMIINYLSYFYLYELYENRNSLNIEELRNTEFERIFLYGVLKVIKELQSKGIIEDNLEIDMIEVPTLENVIKAIQDIKIVNIDRPKTLTLKN